MIDYFGIENVLWFLVIGGFYIAYIHDRFSKNTLNHIDRLQNRVNELEERLGMKKN